ncbi:hypothetical protein M0R89_03830 [Halorussus limi]|uniref:Uncharacterized protein n=1 Tax=Halorussus limi TaxID=2938695 RepID=A0A8U0HVR5_9EURY|nr:hypothetical protein [Halorussus limi]UPV75205.1 hypothetical protein M0R89_03830 [Halorussus limi]
MPLSEDQWEQAEPDQNVIALVYGFLEDEKPTAYSIEEIFTKAEASVQDDSSSTWEDVGAVLGEQSAEDEYRWAFEYLVHAGELEKRAVVDGGEKVEFYRAT